MSTHLMAASLITVEIILLFLEIQVPKVTASATITTTSSIATKENDQRQEQQQPHQEGSSYSAALSSLLGVELPEEFEVVYPYFADEKGRIVTSLSEENETITRPERRKRYAGEEKTKRNHRLYIGIEHQNEKLVLKLRANKKLLSPHATLDKLLSNKLQETENLSNECYYIGRLKHQRHSVIAVDICNGLTGFIQAKERAYFIAPLHGVLEHRIWSAHLLYPLNASRPISLANDQWIEDDIVENKTIVERNIRSAVISNDVSDMTSPKLKEKYMAVAVAADHSVVKFHGEKIEQFILILMNIVNAIYSDPSLGAKLSIIVTRIILLKESEDNKISEGNSRESLENVCHWFKEMNRNHSGFKHDIGIYLTRLDIGGPAGYAPVGGMCNPRRSCSLNRDEGLTSAFVIAHEIGHVLGFSHDGDEEEMNTCSQDGSEGSIMAPLVLATFTRFHWSKCTVSEYRNKINKWFCLNDKPSSLVSKLSFQTPLGRQYSLDEQCRMEFGEGFLLCRAYLPSDPCTHLWCSNRSNLLLCKTKKGPPLEGTPCGKGKWCAQGYCQQMNKKRPSWDLVMHNPRHGGWGEWSPYGDCSRSCGGGVRFRTRKCDNPKPAFGGKHCPNANEEFVICNKQNCPAPQDFRAEQCATLAGVRHASQRRSKIEWVPYPVTNDSMFCKLTCISKRTREIFISEENVIDGTPCSYDIPHHMCVQGQCQRVGCDKILGSNKTDDSCGTCDGNNTNCKNTHKIFVRTPVKANMRVTILPRGARNIQVKEMTSTPNNLVLHRRKTKEFFLTGKFSHNFVNQTFVCEGTRFIYVRTNTTESLTAKGPLLDELVIMLASPIPNPKIPSTITVDFTMSLKKDSYESEFVWDVLSWSQCSRTCGGGDQLTKVVCRSRRTDRVVSKRFCSILEKPSIKRRPCNKFSCAYRWRTGPWEHCTHTCGSRGYQQRQLFCIPMNESSAFVNPELCTDHKPEERRACNRKPCPSQWVVGSWSQCSTTCGVGVQIRNVTCIPPENEILFECRDRPEQRRECVRRSCRDDQCTEDVSEFCQLKVLHRYCQIPSYKNRCCHTCSNYVSES